MKDHADDTLSKTTAKNVTQVHEWIRERARPDSAASLPLLILIVTGLPMSALIEIQIEAGDPGTPPIAQIAWERRRHGVVLSCAGVIGGLNQRVTSGSMAVEVSTGLGMLQCIVATDADSISLEDLIAALRDTISEFMQRSADRVQWAGWPCYARCYRDRDLHVSRTALRHAILSAVDGATCHNNNETSTCHAQPVGLIPGGGPDLACAEPRATCQSAEPRATCQIVDLPVVCVAHKGARLAVQIYFDAPAATT